ncbi:hypothetical protein LTR37_001125 [Vermiconidia calcicola]|uniref:Uncharacterized protein n=1 Tax=Vermiconidia calcicola TaxID=1690605 RepID=A0ACC3NX91_9PEZI|nr:hypothetical protein LTR37_001125 [Vermiconidia calcicola]
MTSPPVKIRPATPAWPAHGDDNIRRSSVQSSGGDFSQSETLGTQLEKTTSVKSAVLNKALSNDVERSSPIDPGPPPDGGLLAWTQVAMVHFTVMSTWGYISSFGVFQTYYRTALDVSPSAISWIGSVQIFLLFIVGTFSGRACDAGFFHYVYCAGSVLQLVGIFTTSAATKYWQLFLSQALCTGLSNGLHFTPAMSLLSTYFAKKRAIAQGVALLGNCTGGLIFPLIAQQLLPRIGFPWTVRIIGFIMLGSNALTITCYRTRLPPRRTGPIVEWSAFTELPFMLLSIAMFFNFWGLYFAFFYIGDYARSQIGLSYRDSINMLITIVAAGVPGRLIPNYIADTAGALNSIIPFAFLNSLMALIWIGISTRSGLFVFAAFYGFGAGGIQSLYPPALSSLTTDLSKAGVRMGMGFSIAAFAAVSGPPLGGALIQQRSNGDYLYAQM